MGIVKLTDLPELEEYRQGDGTVFVAVQNGVLYQLPADLINELLVGSSLDSTLTDEAKAANAKAVGDELAKIKQDIEDLKYVPIEITAFTARPSSYLMGSTADAVVLSWSTNKTPKAVKVKGIDVDPEATTFTDERGYTSNTSFRLTVTDEREKTAERDVWIYFQNVVYYGGCAVPEEVTGELVSSLTQTRKDTRQGTYQATVGDGQRFVFALPSRMGTPTFAVGGFVGGFSRIAEKLDVTNTAGYTEHYDVWASDQEGLGNTSVVVS